MAPQWNEDERHRAALTLVLKFNDRPLNELLAAVRDCDSGATRATRWEDIAKFTEAHLEKHSGVRVH